MHGETVKKILYNYFCPTLYVDRFMHYALFGLSAAIW